MSGEEDQTPPSEIPPTKTSVSPAAAPANAGRPRSTIPPAAGEIQLSASTPRRFWLPLSILVFSISAVLLFYRLGFYPLWGDEADTALYARGIARTGDTYAVFEHNVYAWRNGKYLKNLHGRYAPPASFYLAAPFVGASGGGAFWPRFPFAVCSLLTVALMLYWMARSHLSALAWTIFSLGLLGNVSFFLYGRQCRYYALATLLTVLIAYLYLTWNGRWWKLTAMMLASILLLWTQYLPYAGLYAALGCDYFLSQRRRSPVRWNHWLLLLGPQVLAGALAVAIYNPIGAGVVPDEAGRNLLLDKLTLFWWNLRDINICEFGVGLLMLAAPVLFLLEKDRWLLRGPLAILSYTLIVTILSPQPVSETSVADVRYLAALIPLCIFLTSLSIVTLTRYQWALALPLALLAFGTNLLNQPWNPGQWRSSICQWVEELQTARMTSIQSAIDWIHDHVAPGQSIWVWPDYMAYPLMYQAPQALYAWQLLPAPEEQFKDLPAIQFIGGDPPDYLLAFGKQPALREVLTMLGRRNVSYTPVATLNIYWNDLTRPELFWRSFKPVQNFNADVHAVYILKRNDLPAAAP